MHVGSRGLMSKVLPSSKERWGLPRVLPSPPVLVEPCASMRTSLQLSWQRFKRGGVDEDDFVIRQGGQRENEE
jgi:hypothetical protein